MFLHVIEARHVEGHRVFVQFNDGTAGDVDLSQSLAGPIFEPLRDVEYFRRFSIEGHTLAWPNGADFAPGVSLAVESLDFSVDFKPIQGFGDYQGFYPLLKQGGDFYVAGGAAMTGTSGWNNYSSSLTESDFDLFTGTTGWGTDPSQQPDFSSSGSPITFGFLTANQFSWTIIAGYDNYSMSVHPVPEPSTLALLATAALAITLGWRRFTWSIGCRRSA